MTSYDEMVLKASGHHPYPWQAQLAQHGLPELIAVETGAGKTAGVVLPWLYRRREHPDLSVRAATPRWLVMCLPLRTLVEQTEASVRAWLNKLGLGEEVLVHVAMGGREDGHAQWRLHPERDAVVLGTVDMLVSRALNRGYGASRFSWPIDYGLLNNGTHWIFDEVQLLGPALQTSRQLQALRERLGTALPTATTWMSATVDSAAMSTVDNPDLASVVSLADADRADPELGRRLAATRRVQGLPIDPADGKRARSIAAELLGHHRTGTLTLAVVNTVKSARELAVELAKVATSTPVTLLHSRFRPADRKARLKEVLGELDPAGPGRIVVSTQVIEAGVDLSATVLLTEAAPWPSIVQRAGRCNRDGLADDALLLWVPVAKPAPYEVADVEATMVALRGLEGSSVTATALREHEVAVTRVHHAVLRMTDFVGLFDTAPDLSGNDIDVAPFIRVGDELDLHIAWRELGGKQPGPDVAPPTAAELCPVPAGKELVEFLAQRGQVWRIDHLSEGDSRWVSARREDLRPGIVLLADVGVGGYTATGGWDPGQRAPVDPVPDPEPSGLVHPEEGLGDDRLSCGQGGWLGLEQHLADVEAAARLLMERLDPSGLAPAMREAAAVAGRLHDIGKVHEVFQDTMIRCAPEDERTSRRAEGPWAKSVGRARHRRRYFRHELASALALLGDASVGLHGVEEPDLVVYLVAAHHGRVRLTIRSVPEEERDGMVLGLLRGGDVLPAVAVPGGLLPASSLSLEHMVLGRTKDGTPSWSERALALRDRPELGPLRLGFLEAVVRLADWRASAAADTRL